MGHYDDFYEFYKDRPCLPYETGRIDREQYLVHKKIKKSQTKEEWFCSLPTEEKAAFLANYFMFDCPMVDKVFQKQEAHNFIGLEKLAKETILEWLREKHEE